MTNDDLVSVLVPRKYLSRVYGKIAELDATTPVAAPFDNGSLAANDVAPDEWTPSLLRKMVEDSGSAMRDILRALATRPGEWFSTHELAAALKNNASADWNTIAGTFGAFGRRVKSRYQLKTWPFQYKRDHEEHRWVYSMSREAAAKILPLLDTHE